MEFKETNPMKLKNKGLKRAKLVGSLKKNGEKNTLVDEIVYQLMPSIKHDIEGSKNALSFIENVCILVENHNCKTKIDKKDVAIKVITSIYPELNNERDLKKISNDIDDICESSKNIVRSTLARHAFNSVKNFFLKS